MELQEYKRIFNHEDSHGWYVGLHKLVLYILQSRLPAHATILDVGCGTGGFLNQLQQIWPNSWGIDLSEQALKYSKKRSLSTLLRGSASHLPIKNCYFDAITCLDVLYHQQIPDDQSVLNECYRILNPGGFLILHNPAFSFLKGAHDRLVHTRERYTHTVLHTRLSLARFHILKISYRNFTLFPLILLKRFFTSSGSDLTSLPDLLNRVLRFILQIENRILEHRTLPLGSSVFCIAQKPLAENSQK